MKTLFMILSLMMLSSISRADVLPLTQQPNTSFMPLTDASLNARSADLKPELKEAPLKTPVRISRFSPEDFEGEEAPSDMLSATPLAHKGASKGLMEDVSPEYIVDRNFLRLTKVPQDRRKRAIMFVFFMNKHKVDPDKPVVLRDNTRTRLHIMGSKKIVNDQKVVDDEYPVDFSIARHDDGYASEEWNLVLPKGKPREVMVSLLWSF